MILGGLVEFTESCCNSEVGWNHYDVFELI